MKLFSYLNSICYEVIKEIKKDNCISPKYLLINEGELVQTISLNLDTNNVESSIIYYNDCLSSSRIEYNHDKVIGYCGRIIQGTTDYKLYIAEEDCSNKSVVMRNYNCYNFKQSLIIDALYTEVRLSDVSIDKALWPNDLRP